MISCFSIVVLPWPPGKKQEDLKFQGWIPTNDHSLVYFSKEIFIPRTVLSVRNSWNWSLHSVFHHPYALAARFFDDHGWLEETGVFFWWRDDGNRLQRSLKKSPCGFPIDQSIMLSASQKSTQFLRYILNDSFFWGPYLFPQEVKPWNWEVIEEAPLNRWWRIFQNCHFQKSLKTEGSTIHPT